MSQPAPTVVIAADFGATLPPRAEREPASERPSVERGGSLASRGRPAAFLGQRPLVAIGALLVTAVAWAVTSGLPSGEEGTAASRLPDFLREASAATPPVDAGAAAALPPVPSRASRALPPELAAMLAQAMSSPQPAASPADAGAPAPAEEEPLSAPAAALLSEPTPPVATETHGQSDAPPGLKAQQARRAALATETQAAPSALTRKPSPLPRAAAATRSTAAPSAPSPSSETPAIVTTWPSDASPSPKAQAPSRNPERLVAPTSAPAREQRETGRAIRPLTTYTYGDKALFSVATAPMRVTDLVLQPGEKLVSQPTAGDSSRWVITVVAPTAQTHVFVKPLRAGLRTNLTLTTDRRSYFLELSSSADAYMAGVQWTYPSDEAQRRREALAQADRERQSTTAISDLQALRFDYRVQVTSGDAPNWKPTMVFDDGQKTFIRFPRPVSPASAPLLFVLRSGNVKDAKFVNYRVKNDLYVLDRLIESAELRLATGDDSQDVVRITRRERH